MNLDRLSKYLLSKKKSTQKALAIRDLGIRGFDYPRSKKWAKKQRGKIHKIMPKKTFMVLGYNVLRDE